MVVGIGGKEGRHLKILVEMDLMKPLVRGTKVKYKNCETWIQFRYEQLLAFCYYCGCIGHNERICEKRMEDLQHGTLKEDQFGS